MKNSLLVVFLLALIIVHLEISNNQSQHQYIASVKYNFFEFQFDFINNKIQHHYM